MSTWETDFYRRPLQDETGNILWELLVCDPDGSLRYQAFCPQSQVSAGWLTEQLQQLVDAGNPLPKIIRAFRPQTFNLLEVACKPLGIEVEPTRQTPTLKHWLDERSRQYPTEPNYNGQPYQALDLEKPPPVPLPENLWGEQWRFAALAAGDLVEAFTGRMIPILELPEPLFPIRLGLASTIAVPGVVIRAGRKSMQLAQWLQQARPDSLNYMAGAPDGLILEAGFVDRWIVATFEDAEVTTAARTYEQRKLSSKGLHFLLVQPDDSGMTYSGFWLLRS
ncbi:Tab2/Atab2 family RNA-binding protein [Kovacikia minuta CCNUW1]|uniref:Tab2/Atab2 family RNA-binding protein n=1 Tax=Kovacikia minuta TaxID=2931930 RepID=UPI001CCA2E1C|nr:Tab2/Atab2 family RNA-binding protein [Kovacikia minuta]UBF28091.1 Tab2/Atab2 family RNA-binding protein [Kovacikia minuta CCNUW1]